MKLGKNQNSAAQIKARTDFHDWLTQTIKIDGVTTVERDTEFDDVPNYRSAGIKLNYTTVVEAMEGLREGVLLEVGQRCVTAMPIYRCDRGSWNRRRK